MRLVLVTAFLAVALTGCASTSSGTTSGDSGSKPATLAEKLATIQAGGNPSAGLAAQFDAALHRLGPKCRERPSVLANEVDNTQHIMQNKGTNESLLSIFEHTDQAIPKALGKTQCAQILAAYVVLRTSG